MEVVAQWLSGLDCCLALPGLRFWFPPPPCEFPPPVQTHELWYLYTVCSVCSCPLRWASPTLSLGIDSRLTVTMCRVSATENGWRFGLNKIHFITCENISLHNTVVYTFTYSQYPPLPPPTPGVLYTNTLIHRSIPDLKVNCSTRRWALDGVVWVLSSQLPARFLLFQVLVFDPFRSPYRNFICMTSPVLRAAWKPVVLNGALISTRCVGNYRLSVRLQPQRCAPRIFLVAETACELLFEGDHRVNGRTRR